MEVEKDQHLLVDKEILKKEIEVSELNKNDRVIEIGAGTGTLTEELTKKASYVLSFEIDKRFSKNLEKLKQKYKNLKITYGNALDAEWKGYNKIVSNIPYSLSEPLIWKAINSNVEVMILIISESFKDNLFSQNKKIGLIANLFFNIKAIFSVKRESFCPVPKTDSWLVKLERKNKLTKVEKIMQRIVTKNSKIKNAIIYSLVESGKTKKQAREIVKKLNLFKDILEKPAKKLTAKLIKRIKERLEEVEKSLFNLHLLFHSSFFCSAIFSTIILHNINA